MSASVSMPRLKHSIAHEITPPAEIVSRPILLQISLLLMMLPTLSLSIMPPKTPMVSYSGWWCAVPWYGPFFTDQCPPQAMLHIQQPYFLS